MHLARELSPVFFKNKKEKKKRKVSKIFEVSVQTGKQVVEDNTAL